MLVPKSRTEVFVLITDGTEGVYVRSLPVYNIRKHRGSRHHLPDQKAEIKDEYFHGKSRYSW